MTAQEMLPPALQARIERLLRRRVAGARRTVGGYSTAERWIVSFDDGLTCFVKSGEAHLATFLRAEHTRVYSRIQARFLPKLLAWEDDGVSPILVLEDLSAAHWPPPWTSRHIAAVLEALNRLQTMAAALNDIPKLVTVQGPDLKASWGRIEADPAPFLSLNLCSASWLDKALAALRDAANEAPLDGDDVVHLDVRSDNLCLRGDDAVLVDWNHTCRGNRLADIAFWLPSLHSEGGPATEQVYELAPAWAALIAGYFASYAGLPAIPQAPRVREVQLSQLKAALPWAQRALGLPPLDGPHAGGSKTFLA